MRELKSTLEAAGYVVRKNEFGCGSVELNTMMNLVSESTVVVVGLSSAFKASKDCRTEYQYAHYELGKPIVLVKLEMDYVPDGWVEELVGSQSWHNCCDVDEVKSNASHILHEVAAKCQNFTSILTAEQEATLQENIQELRVADTAVQQAASRKIQDAVAWKGGTEENRPQREVIGYLGGVEMLCSLVRSTLCTGDAMVRKQINATAR